MAQIETWVDCYLGGLVQIQYLEGNVFSMDKMGNRVGVTVYDIDGNPADIAGTVTAHVIRSDGNTVAVTGSRDGNKCWVDLPQACYYCPGTVVIAIKLTSGTTITTLACVVSNVYQSYTGSTVDPGTIISSIEDLITAINTAVAGIPLDWAKLAPAFSDSTSYVAGQYCTYNSNLYRFTSAHSGSWNASHVAAVTVGGELTDLKSAIAGNFSTSSKYRKRSFAYYDNALKKWLVTHDPGAYDASQTANTKVMTEIANMEDAIYYGLNKVGWSPTIDKGRIIKATTGKRTTNASGKYACTHNLSNGYGYRNIVTLDNGTYEMLLMAYGTGASITEGTSFIGSYGNYTNEIIIPDFAISFAVNFHRKDDAVLTDADVTAIAAALNVYRVTDTELILKNIPADAKTVGDQLTTINGQLADLQGAVTKKKYSLMSGNITPTGKSGDNNTRIRTYSKALYPITAGDTLVLDGDYELDTAHIYSSNSVSKVANVTTLTITDTQELEIPSQYVGQYLGFAIIKTSMSGQDISAYVSDAEQHVRLRNAKGIQEEINELNERVGVLENGYDIPDYYFENDYLDDKVEAINTISLNIGRNGARFVFITDYHIEDNARRSPSLIEYLMEKTGIKNVMFGGDAYNNSYGSKEGAIKKLCMFMNDFKNINANGNMFYITGNHEYNNADLEHDSTEIDEAAVFNLFNSPITNKIYCLWTNTRENNAFYIDDDAAKMRIYALDCNHAGQLSPLTIGLVLASFGDVPEGYSVMLFSHCGIGTITNGVGELTDRMEALMKGAKALNDGTSATITLAVGDGYTWNVDYTGKARTFICAITGHRHSSAYCIYDGRFPVLLTTCDTGAYRSEYTARVAGTITEQAFDVVQIDLATKRIYLTRIGNGSDRVFSFGENAGPITE